MATKTDCTKAKWKKFPISIGKETETKEVSTTPTPAKAGISMTIMRCPET